MSRTMTDEEQAESNDRRRTTDRRALSPEEWRVHVKTVLARIMPDELGGTPMTDSRPLSPKEERALRGEWAYSLDRRHVYEDREGARQSVVDDIPRLLATLPADGGTE